MDKDVLKAAVNTKTNPVYMTGRSDVVEYYKDKYGANWKTAIVNDRMKSSPDANRASVRREYQYDKRTGQDRYLSSRQTAATKARYEALGKSLPPIGRTPKGGEITITVKGTQYEKKGEHHREWTATFTGSDAIAFANNPNYRDFFKQLDYPDWVIDRLEGGDSSAVDGVEVA